MGASVVVVDSGELVDPIIGGSIGTDENICVGAAVDVIATPVGDIVSDIGVCD